MHPHAFRDNNGGFIDGNDRKVTEGDLVEYKYENHRRGVLDEALQDGDAFVTWDDGSFGTVKWIHLCKINHHIDNRGYFQSDKYPELDPDKIIVSFEDPHAYLALSVLATSYKEKDPELSEAIEERLRTIKSGY